MNPRFLRLLAVASLLWSMSAFGQKAEPQFVRDAIGVRSSAAAPRLAEQAKIAPAISLGSSAADLPEKIEEIHRFNATHPNETRNGFTRPTGDVLAVRLGNIALAKEGGAAPNGRGVVSASADNVVWSGSVEVAAASRLRLHLENVKLPEGSTMWVYGKGEQPTAFGRELIDANGNLWTPSVAGDTVYLELEVPAKAAADAAFDLREVLELIAAQPDDTFTRPPVQPVKNDTPSCLKDVTCVAAGTLDVLDQFSKSVAHLEYVKGSASYVCSGGLINDTDSTTSVPYLLTANHCFDTQASATTLEAYWDYKFASCVSTTVPSLSTLQRSLGATLLATSANSDFTFVRLNSIPAGRVLLGWDSRTSAVPAGRTLYRISHPAPDGYGPQPQMFSTTTVSGSSDQCDSRPRSRYIYSTQGTGGVYGGSSGSPVIISGGYIVGQLFGSCGADPTAGCDDRNYTVDGAFSESYASVKQWLEPTQAQPDVCTPSATTMCINNNRFAISVNWTNASGQSGTGTAIKYTPDSGLFWFFGSDNIEMLVKVLNGCGVNNRYWVFGAASTDVAYTLTVRDTKLGTVKTYTNALGNRAPAITDTGAFASCP